MGDTPAPSTSQEIVTQILAPLAQAGADRIRYGDKNAALALNLGTTGNANPWPWVFGGLMLALFVSGKGHHY